MFSIRGRKYCRGCSLFYPSVAVGIIIGLLFDLYRLDPFILGPLMTLLVLPTMITLMVRLPRIIRDLNKTILGLNTGLALVVIILHPLLIVKTIVIVVLITGSWLVEKHRARKDYKKCLECSDFDKRQSYECAGLQPVGDRLSLVNIVNKPQIPDPLQNVSQVTKFEDL
ncbi:MAG: hypothetical protein ACFFD4_14605 [Candidatus Odinarchaeota archaeon]